METVARRQQAWNLERDLRLNLPLALFLPVLYVHHMAEVVTDSFFGVAIFGMKAAFNLKFPFRWTSS